MAKNKSKGKELANKFFVKQNYVSEEYFEEVVADVSERLQRRYPDAIIEKHYNKTGVRIVAYERRK